MTLLRLLCDARRVSAVLSASFVMIALATGPAKADRSQAKVPAAASQDRLLTSPCEELYYKGRYIESARACEAAGSFYVAGMARWAAGHDALALDRWRTYLARDEDAVRKKEIEERIKTVLPMTSTVRVEAQAVPEKRTLVLRLVKKLAKDEIRQEPQRGEPAKDEPRQDEPRQAEPENTPIIDSPKKKTTKKPKSKKTKANKTGVPEPGVPEPEAQKPAPAPEPEAPEPSPAAPVPPLGPEESITIPWPAEQGSIAIELDKDAEWAIDLSGDYFVTATETITVRPGQAAAVKLATVRKTADVRVMVGPEKARRGGVEINLDSTHSAPRASKQAENLFPSLAYGPWTLSLAARGYVPKKLNVVVEGPLNLEYVLERIVPDRKHRILSGIFGGGFVAFTAAGVVTTVQGAREVAAQREVRHDGKVYDNIHNCTWDQTFEGVQQNCSAASNAVRDLSVGVGLLGVGIGALVPAGVALAPDPRKAARTEAIVGAGLLAGSAAWTTLELYYCQPANDYRDSDLLRGRVATAALGASTMILSGALIQLLVERGVKKRDARASRRNRVEWVRRESKEPVGAP